MKLLLALLLSTNAFAQTVFFPNPGVHTAWTGTIEGGLASGNVHITGSVPGFSVIANQGTKGTIPESWYVQPCDGTNCQSFLPTGEAEVVITQPLPAGANTIGGVTQSGIWSVGRTWALDSTTDNVFSLLKDGSGNALTSTGGALDVNVTTPISVSNPSIGVNGSANPADSTQVGGVDGSGNLQPISITASGAVKTDSSATTQPISAASLPLPTNAAQETGGNLSSLATHQTDGTQKTQIVQGVNTAAVTASSALKVDGSAVTQPISAASLPLPANAAKESGGNLDTIALNQTNRSQLTKITNGTYDSDVKPLNLQVVGTDYGIITNSVIHGLTTAGGGSYVDVKVNPSGAMVVDGSGSTQPVSGTVTVTQATGTNLHTVIDSGTITTITNPVQVKDGINTTGSGSAASATVSTVITLSHPANAVGFILMNLDTSTANVRWSIGRAATTTLGQQLQPGRDTGFVPCGADVSLVSESGTQTYDIQWVSQ